MQCVVLGISMQSLLDDLGTVWLFIKNLGIVFKHLYWLVIVFVVLITVGGLFLSRFDQKPLFKSIYLAFITALTIGYGDVTPHTRPAKFVSIVVGLLGLIVTGVVVAAAIKAAEVTIEEVEMLPVEDIQNKPLSVFPKERGVESVELVLPKRRD